MTGAYLLLPMAAGCALLQRIRLTRSMLLRYTPASCCQLGSHKGVETWLWTCNLAHLFNQQCQLMNNNSLNFAKAACTALHSTAYTP